MPPSHPRHALAWLLSLASLPALASPPPPSAGIGEAAPGPRTVRIDDPAVARALEALGAVREGHDYGSFAWLVVDPGVAGAAALLDGPHVEAREEARRLLLSGQALDDAARALRADERWPGEEDGGLPADAGLYLVQYAAPVRGAWRAELEATGARVLQVQPHRGYLVQAAPGVVPRLVELAARPEVRHVGVFEPGFRVAPSLRAAARARPDEVLAVTVQLLAGPAAAGTEAEVLRLARRRRGASDVGPFRNLYVELAAGELPRLARDPAVVAVVPRGEPVQLRDERQALVVAGLHDGTRPGPPGYLDWLRAQGFDETGFQDFVVHVVDSTIFLTGHPDLPDERVAFEHNPTNQTQELAHGFLVASILGGYQDEPGFPYQDPLGYAFGLGVSPFARLGCSAVFGPGPGFDPAAWELAAYANEARISTNSWGTFVLQYEALAQLYDFLVRDVDPGAPGNQELIVLAGAGNSGPGSGTVIVPSLAKNVLCVGGSEGWRPEPSAVCMWGPRYADDVGAVAVFSSRGPVAASLGDGRTKPDVLAPASAIEAGVPQSSYGGVLCEPYYPPGQTLYSWASGTSFSTPAVAGAASLVYQRFLDEGRPPPSPAMTKALLANTAAYLRGPGAGDTLPSNAQGFGRVDLGLLFDDTARVLADQAYLLGEPGEEYRVAGVIDDPQRPLRVTLAWTDAPGPLTGAPYVNDLDLLVDLEGTLYRGNVFSGPDSVPGGAADFRNNVESVFLPPGAHGEFLLTVRAADVPGDGVPGNGDPTDQDFALVISNAREAGGYGCGPNPVGSLKVLAGAPRLGGRVVLGLGDPSYLTPAGTLPVLALALAPDPAFPCGRPVPGGELLIDPRRRLPGFLVGAPWNGATASPVELAIPPDPALVGLSLYAQGALLGQAVTLTNGYHLRIAP